MTSKGKPKRQAPGGVTAVVAERINQLRKRRTLTAQQLAERCKEAGAPDITAQAISNIETGRPDEDGRRRRLLTVDELLVLASVLDVAPVHLLVPMEEDAPYPVTPGRTEASHAVREWVRGFAALPGADVRGFYSEVPEHEFGKQPPSEARRRWERALFSYVTRTGGRIYRREDGALVLEMVRPAEGSDDG